ncbi:uncharacterized protein KIAA2026-like [Gigantopelta aegis]|uniref:uncharacterized protein KIAA2026-like n=1 Tax=Gigantopelta aegis TaxID=1735272 RepID=UPI001B88CECE|nr:uncharacterized protein KIAA2026-like [Gigantopelta aegis]
MRSNVSSTVMYGMEVTGDNVSSVDIKHEIDDLSPKHTKSSSWDDRLAPEMEYPSTQMSLDVLESRDATPEHERDIEVKEERTPMSYELQQGERILRELMSDTNKHFNWPFIDAVDASIPELSDYYERVKSPMWLRKMQEKFDLRQYDTITEFVADFRQMLENCFRYNGPDHYVSKRAQRLETMLEQKLALLSRDLREKTTIEATSGSSNNSSNRGIRRRGFKSIIPHDSSNLLNQLREEEVRRVKELRLNQIAERKAVNEAWLNDLQGWEDELLSDPYRTHMKAMWELPQIGLFLFLCQTPLNLLEVTQFELERCFAMVKQSSTLQWMMTSLLSTPFQRTKIDKKTLMPYSVWNEKLMARMSLWYKALDDAKGDIYVASSKLGIDTFYFDVVGKKNPILKKKFHELSFYRKVWIMKTLCDHCLEVQESLRDAIEFQPPADQHEYVLGWDAKGYSYLHFPQFCGADVRIYRQAPLPEPDEEDCIETRAQCTNKEDYVPPVKKKKRSSGNFGRRKRPNQVKKVKKAIPEEECSDNDETEDTSEVCSTAPSRSLTATPEKKPTQEDEDISEVCSAAPSRSLTATPEVNDVDSDTSSLSSNWSARSCRRKCVPRRGLARKLLKQFDSTEVTDDSNLLENYQLDTSDLTLRKSVRQENRKASVICDRRKDANFNNEVSCKYAHVSHSADIVKNGETVSGKDNSADKVESDIKHNCNQREITSDACDNGGNVDGVNANDCERMDCSSDISGSRDIKMRGGQVCDKGLTSQISHNEQAYKTDSCVSILEPDKKTSDVSSGLPEKSLTLKERNGVGSDINKNTNQRENHPETNSTMNYASHNSFNGDTLKTLPQRKLESSQDETNGTCMMNTEDCLSKPELSNHKEENLKTAVCDMKMKKESCVDEFSNVLVDSSVKVMQKCVKLDVKQERSSTVNGVVSCEVKKECVSEAHNEIQKMMKQECETESDSDVRCPVKQECESPMNEDTQKQLKVERVTDSNEDVQPKELKEECASGLNNEVREQKKQDDVTEMENAEECEDEEEEIVPVVGHFELIVENVQQLREMCDKFAEPEPVSVRKGRKMVKPPPRKRCVIELHERLLFLLNELEPWETKLCQATRRARVKMRKEFENYKEEEPQETLKDWDTDRSDEGQSDSDDDDSSEMSEVETKEKKSPRKSTSLPQKTPETSLPEDYEFDVSSRGRLRKRRVIPNNTEDQFCKKRKLIKVSEESVLPVNVPNILMKQKLTSSVGNVVPSGEFQSSSGSVLARNLASASQLLRMSLVNPSTGKAVLSSSTIRGQRFQVLENTSVTQSSHPVIQSLLSIRKSTASMTGEAGVRKLQVSGENDPVTASAMQASAPGGNYNSIGTPIHIVTKPTATSQKTLHFNTLPSGVLQQLLKNKAMRIQTAGGATTILLTAPVKQMSPPIQQGLQQQTLEAATAVQIEHQSLSVQSCQAVTNLSLNNQNSTTAIDGDDGQDQIITLPTSSFPFKVPASDTITSSSSAANSLGMLSANMPMLSPSKQRYANNITVKELLETRVAHGKVQPSDVGGDGLNIDADPPTVAGVQGTGQSSFIVKNIKQSAIDTAIKSVMASVNTSLPTVNIKIPAPVTLPSINLRKNVTKTIQAMKSPITVTPKLESLVSSSTSAGSDITAPLLGQTVLPTSSALGSQMSFLVQGTVGAGAASSQKNVILKGTPQTVLTSQGVVQGYLTPQGLIIPANQVQAPSGPKVTSAKPVQFPVSPQHVNISSPEAISKAFVVQSVGHKPIVAAQTALSSQNKKGEAVLSSVSESVLQSPLASPAVMQSLSAALKLKSQSQTNKNILSAPQKVSTITSPDGKRFTLTNVNLGQVQKAGVPDNSMTAVLTGLSSKVSPPGTPAAQLMKQIVAGQQGQMANIVLGASPKRQGVVVSGDSKQLGLKVEKVEQPSMIPAVVVNQPGATGATQKKIVLPLQNIRQTLLQGGMIVSTSPMTSPPAGQNMLNSAVRQIFPADAQPQVPVPGKLVTTPVKLSTPCVATNKVNKLVFPCGQQLQQLTPGQNPVLLTAQHLQTSPVQQSSHKPGVLSKGQVILPQKDGIVQPTRLVLNPQLMTGQIAPLPLGKLAVPQSPVQKVIYNLPQNTILQQGMTTVPQSPLNIVGVSPSPSLPNASVRFLFPSFSTLPASLNRNLQPVSSGTSLSKPQTVSSSSGIVGSNQSKQGLPDVKPHLKPPNAKANHPTLASALLQTSKQISQPIKTEIDIATVQTGIARSPAVLPACSNVGISSMKLPDQSEHSHNAKHVDSVSVKDAVHTSPLKSAPIASHGPAKSDMLHMQLSTESLGNQTHNNKIENALTSISNVPNMAAVSMVSPNVPSTGLAESSATKQQKLMLFNIGGQLMTAQGVPVTVHQGVLKVLPQATIQVGSQVLTVRAPSSSLVQTVPPVKKTSATSFSPSSGIQLPVPTHTVSSSAVNTSVHKLGDTSQGITQQSENLLTVKAEMNFDVEQNKVHSFSPNSGKSLCSAVVVGTMSDVLNHPQKGTTQELPPSRDGNRTSSAFPPKQVMLAASHKQNTVPSDSTFSLGMVDGSKVLHLQSTSAVDPGSYRCPTKTSVSSTTMHQKMVLANSGGAAFQVVPTSKLESLAAPNMNNISEKQQTATVPGGSVLCLTSPLKPAPNTPTKSREEAALNLLSLAAVGARNNKNQF